MTKTILLVEDDPRDQELILRTLKEGGVANEVVTAEDGADALAYLWGTGRHAGRDASDTPAVVVLDLRLPKLDGFEVLRRLRADARTRRQPVVVLTSSDEDKDRLSCYDLGANSYVRKPVDFDDFKRAVQELKLYWLLINRPPA